MNGVPMDEIRDWYIANTGYVLQLASPYYEELTVRENLTLAAQIKLPSNFTAREKFERVEQVMEVVSITCTQSCTCICMHMYTHSHIHTHIHMHARTQTYMCKYTVHTHTHTHTHTQIDWSF